MVTIAEVEVWFALAGWVLTFAVMLRSAVTPACRGAR
jgi:hypothetical protein